MAAESAAMNRASQHVNRNGGLFWTAKPAVGVSFPPQVLIVDEKGWGPRV
jgi:hypothetical protein